MKKLTLLLIGLLTLPFFSLAGGIVTNQNQSASYIRMFARDASTNIDAVFFNPAGLTKLDNGFYLSLNNQYISQNQYVTSNYEYLNGTPVEYHGTVQAPLFPGLYAAYNIGKFSISLGINPVGGGGSATFKNGLPSFEVPVSNLVPSLYPQPVTAYSMNAYFEGSSVFWGYQLGVSYEINDMLSIYLGARYVTAKNTYSGHLTDIMINYAGTETSASAFFATTATNLEPLYTGFTGLYDAAGGALRTLTLAEAQAGGYITATEQATLEGGLTALGVPTNTPIGAAYEQAVSPSYLGARRAEHVLADQDGVDVEQTGSGYTPIIGVNFSPNDKLNIGLKYEFQTKLELKNNTTKDFITDYDYLTNTETGMFPDGEVKRNDMPALLSIGLDYKITDKFSAASGFHYYFDKSADYGKKVNGVSVKNSDIIDHNSFEWALGFEYKLSDKILLSAGYLMTQTGVTADYQSDMSFSLNSNTVGLGGAFSVSPMIDLNLGLGYTMYTDNTKTFDVVSPATQSWNETYDKNNLFIALGLDFKFGKKSE